MPYMTNVDLQKMNRAFDNLYTDLEDKVQSGFRNNQK